jgi:dihydropyrimidinase
MKTLTCSQVVWDRDNGGYVGKRGDGNYLKRKSSMLRGPRNVFVNEWRPPAEVFKQSTEGSKFSSCLDFR